MNSKTQSGLWTFAVLLIAAKLVSSEGYMQIQFETYENKDGRVQDGTYCDPFGTTFVGDKCDPQFRLMADRYTPGGNGLYDYTQPSVYWDTEYISFGGNFAGISNPVAIAMNYENPGFLHITVSVVDKDTIPPDDPMDTFSATLLALADSTRKSIEMTSQPFKHTLKITYWFTCNAYFHGLDCNRFCKPENSDKGHYTCSPDGVKVCLAGWTGASCVTPDPCYANPCVNGGTCSDVGGVADCRCPSSFTGRHCETDVNECASTVASPCLNAGACENTFGSFNCKCSAGFTGRLCEFDVNECETGKSPCLNNGTCVNSFGGHSCSCPIGLIGKRCELDVNECEDGLSLCSNDSTCVNNFGNFTCQCPPGFDGWLCDDDINECLIGSPCSNGSTCINTVGNFTCECAPGFEGWLCEDVIDECRSSPCSNGGTCITAFRNFTCRCPPGYTGRFCEADVDECLSSPCSNGGACVNSVGSFTCRCSSGFTGALCEADVNECSMNTTCRNGGSCVNTLGNFSCACLSGFSGRNCEQDIDECAEPLNVCRNGGFCNNNFGGFICRCSSGFTGRLCDSDIDECSQTVAVCLNNGTCNNTQGGFSCLCLPGFNGNRCEARDPQAVSAAESGPYCSEQKCLIVGLSVGSGVMLLILVLVTFCLIKKCRHTKSPAGVDGGTNQTSICDPEGDYATANIAASFERETRAENDYDSFA